MPDSNFDRQSKVIIWYEDSLYRIERAQKSFKITVIGDSKELCQDEIEILLARIDNDFCIGVSYFRGTGRYQGIAGDEIIIDQLSKIHQN